MPADHRSFHLPDPETQSEFYAEVPLKRLFAWLADTLIILLICFALSLLSVGIGFFVFGLLVLVVGFAYRVVTLANNSATLGMQLVSIEFRDSFGGRFELTSAFLHTLGYSVSFAFPILQVISIVLMLTTARKQGLTDHVMGTVAINRAARF